MFQIRWIWRNMDRKYRVGVIAALLISVVTSVMLLINPALTAQLIDQVIIAENPEPLLRLLAIMLVAKVLREGLRYLMIVCLEKGSQNVVFNLRRRLFAVLQYQEMRFFDRNRTGDLMTRLSADLDWCRHFVSYLAYMVVDCSVMFLSTLLFFFTVSWKLTLALLAVDAAAAVDYQALFLQGAPALYRDAGAPGRDEHRRAGEHRGQPSGQGFRAGGIRKRAVPEKE